ncbi:MAG: RNA-binding protein [Phycisphaerae bacterium]|nr:RNA-binding protein [Phycisphaerae bacterium]
MVVFVGNFSRDTTEQDLLDKFEQYGRVTTINVMRDEISERTLGFGFIEMADSAAARQAIADLNHSKLKGSTLIVCETAPRIERRRFAQKQSSVSPLQATNQG